MESKIIIALLNPVTAANIGVYNISDLSNPVWNTTVWAPDVIPAIKSVYTEKMDSIQLVGPREFVRHVRDELEMQLPQAKIEIVDTNKMEIKND